MNDTLSIIKKVERPDFITKALFTALEDNWKIRFLLISNDILERLDRCSFEEKEFSTLNNYLSTNYQNLLTYPEKARKAFINSIKELDYGAYNNTYAIYKAKSLSEVKKTLEKKLNEFITNYEHEFARKGLEEQ